MNVDLAGALDERLEAPVLVTGRQVPGREDLQLVADEAGAAQLQRVLSSLGFESRGRIWARFDHCDADVVSVYSLADWRVPVREVERLARDAVAVDGCRRLHWLSTSDELLVLSRRMSTEDIDADPARREQLHRALVTRPSAWVDAAEHAELWGVPTAVNIARGAFDGARTVGARDRRELARETGETRPAPRTGVIALSGLDGSGKSTQAHALAATLPKLGHDVSLEWLRLAFNPSLNTIAAPVKAALALRRARPGTPTGDGAGRGHDAARGLRDRSRTVHQAWTGVVATANGVSQRRTTRAQLQQRRFVVRDRYVLDSVVQLHSDYGARHDVSAQARLIETLSPEPLLAFYLDVPPDVAHNRKPEEYDVAELTAHAALYRREADRLGVATIDAARSRDEVAAEIARIVWSQLG